MSETTKLSVLLSSMTLSMVDDLCADTDAASRSEVLRNCIRLAFAIHAAKNAGAKVWIEDPEGKITKLVFSPVLPLEPDTREDK